ncbi:MAG: cobalamin biosynthesis protein, partial [Mariprofundaceae bacterium]
MNNKTTFARELRQNQTDAEQKLWQCLRNRQLKGFKFRRQYVIDGYIADFACVDAKLIVELDGGQHLEQQTYDAKRSAKLESHGFKVMRFWNDEVLNNTEAVLGVIFEALEDTPSPQPSPSKKERGRHVVLGLGCDRGTALKTIEEAIKEALETTVLSMKDVVAAASIDKKSDEAGLLAVCEKYDWKITFYSAEVLKKVDVPNPSDVVLKYVGTPSVGEAAAILCAGGSKDDLIVEKYKYRGA